MKLHLVVKKGDAPIVFMQKNAHIVSTSAGLPRSFRPNEVNGRNRIMRTWLILSPDAASRQTAGKTTGQKNSASQRDGVF
jgi:hypothetical protein